MRHAPLTVLTLGGGCGTPPYMPPEQWGYDEVDARVDVYAMGCILYEMLMGKYVFDVTKHLAASSIDIFRHHHENTTPPHLPDTFPKQVDNIIQTCLQKEPDKRYSTIADMLADLQACYYAEYKTDWAISTEPYEWTYGDFYNRGLTHHYLGRHEAALRDYDSAIELNLQYATPYYNIACHYALQKDVSSALPYLRKTIEINSQKYCSMIMTDSDFDGIRHATEFKLLLAEFCD